MINSLKAWIRRTWITLFGLSFLALFIIIVLYPRIVHTIQPGHLGVKWFRFFGGTDVSAEGVIPEGLALTFPWDRLYIYDARLRSLSVEVEGLSSDGLKVSVNFVARYTIMGNKVGYLHKSIGPNYEETLLKPQLRELALSYLSKNQASDLYSDRRSRVQKSIEAQFSESMKSVASNTDFTGYYVKTEDVLMAHVRLPDFVARAIEEKEKVRHINESYEFRLMLEDKERRRKRLEAEGIRSFQEIIAPGITESYLRWRGIQATLELSKSNNTKVVIIGDKDGLPIILNTEDNNNRLLSTPKSTTNSSVGGADNLSEPFQGGEPFQIEVESSKTTPSPALETEEMIQRTTKRSDPIEPKRAEPMVEKPAPKVKPTVPMKENDKDSNVDKTSDSFLDKYKIKTN